jgi:hypothetical protein
MASKIHKAVDICFDKSIIDIPVWKDDKKWNADVIESTNTH